ncbi:MAG: transglutaminase-like domain-containing protein [Eubacteriales bacterium]|nr:transglutaminase-like domain-containing protein [Eubacteriales bacterium]
MKTDNRISLHCAQSEVKEPNTFGFLSGVIALLPLLGGLCILLCSMLPSANVSWPMLFAVSVVCGTVLLLLYSGHLGGWILPCGCVLLTIVFVVLKQTVMAAAGTVMNDVTDALSHVTGRIYLDYPAADTAFAVLLPLLLLCALLAACAAAHGKLWPILPILLPVGIGGIMGLIPMGAGWLLLACGTVLLLGGCRARQMVSRLAVVLICTAMVLGIGALVNHRADTAWQGKLQADYHAMRYGRTEDSMPEGQLENLGPWEKNDTPALAVTMESPQKLYLRGSVWETYTGSSWEPLSAQTRSDDGDLFYWLHESDFFGQSQIALASTLTGTVKPAALHVETLGACRGHAYLPYALAGNETLDADVIGDAGAQNEATDYAYLPGSLPTWYALQHTLTSRQGESQIADYLTMERAYADYVYKADLQLTEESRAVIQRQLGELEDSYTLSEIQTMIRNYLGEKMRYDERVSTHLHGGDFLHDTLECSGSGYSVHYATTAVLMLRYFGVPARYVEGYYLSPTDAAKVKAGEEIALTGENAHAWAEYYLEGVGFVPFEVTPGYVDPEDLHAGGIDSNALGSSYHSEKLDYAVVEEPEPDPEGGQNGLHHFKAEHLPYLLLLPLLLFVAWIVGKRIRLTHMLRSFCRENDRQAVMDWYGYAIHLRKLCPVTLSDDSQAMLLNQEAQFSRHEITSGQRQQMEKYAQDTVTAVRQKGSFFQKLRWRWIDGIL